MKKYTVNESLNNPERLAQLFLQRRSPLLSPEGGRKVLMELTDLMVRPVYFLAAFFPKKGSAEKKKVFTEDIESVDLMMDQEQRRFLPVFTTYEAFTGWKPELRPGEVMYVLDKQDLLNFLNGNPAVAGVVVNPFKDDLILDIPTLNNLIMRSRTELVR